MMQVRPVFVREAALLLAELAKKAEAGEAFAQSLHGEAAGGLGLDDRARGPVPIHRPQPEAATGFAIHAALPEGPERPTAPLAFAAYAARLAERVVIEGPVAAFSLRV